MYKKIFYVLIRHSAFTKLVFLLYYSHVIKATVAALSLKNELKTTWFEEEPNQDMQASSSAIARLEENVAFVPDYNPALKIMFLGDSITHGVRGIGDWDSGGYRTKLWQKFESDALQVKFVGSMSSGPECLGDKTHEGHPSWTIKQISAQIDEWLNAYQPDLILLMIGTNDTRKSSLKTMIEDLSILIDQITTCTPNTELLIASIPPVHPAAKPMIRGIRALYFNAAIPSIVNTKRIQGKKVHFVNMQNLTINDLTASQSVELDRGLHPNTEGYRKIANYWHDAIFKVISKHVVSMSTQ